MRDLLHLAGLVLAAVGTGVALLTEGASTGACVVGVVGCALCIVTHKPGVHGPEEG
jgi:hypothetical protein